VAELRDQAVVDGMLTLRMDWLKKNEKGVTTLEEVVKETAELASTSARCSRR
jgi:type II secretory ATPase GspE/PulE/Tfp pilus assembly ATPase PilB-like protein